MAAAIDLVYTLEEKEVFRALKKSGIYKTSGKRAIIEDIILFVFGLYFIFSFALDTSNYFYLVMGIICFVFMLLIYLVPTLDMKRQSKKQSGDRPIKMRLMTSKIILSDGEKEWTIPLDGTSKCRIIDENLILIITPDKQLVVLPVRVIPREKTYEIQSRIFDGTIQEN